MTSGGSTRTTSWLSEEDSGRCDHRPSRLAFFRYIRDAAVQETDSIGKPLAQDRRISRDGVNAPYRPHADFRRCVSGRGPPDADAIHAEIEQARHDGAPAWTAAECFAPGGRGPPSRIGGTGCFIRELLLTFSLSSTTCDSAWVSYAWLFCHQTCMRQATYRDRSSLIVTVHWISSGLWFGSPSALKQTLP